MKRVILCNTCSATMWLLLRPVAFLIDLDRLSKPRSYGGWGEKDVLPKCILTTSRMDVV